MTSPLYAQASFPHCHSLAPDAKLEFGVMGPMALPYSWTIGNGASAQWDLTKELENGGMTNLQGVFIDNSANSSPVTLASSEITGMQIVVGPNMQGVFPFYGKTFSTVSLSTPNASAVKVNLIFLNTPQPYSAWKCI